MAKKGKRRNVQDEYAPPPLHKSHIGERTRANAAGQDLISASRSKLERGDPVEGTLTFVSTYGGGVVREEPVIMKAIEQIVCMKHSVHGNIIAEQRM